MPVYLTPRECEVLQAVADTDTREEVAARLGSTRSTVSQHLLRVYDKLNVHNSRDAVAKARELGLIT